MKQGDNMILPTVRGANLERQNMEFPTDFSADFNLVFVAFQRWHQTQVDSWVPAAEALRQEIGDFQFYEFPTLHRMGFFGRTFLNEGMRAGIPDSTTRSRTITLYLDKEQFRTALDIPNEEDIWVFLFDRSGRVLWRSSGAYTEEKGFWLKAALAWADHIIAV
jgi:hypothetical protein